MKYKTPLSLRNLAAKSQNWLCFYCELPMSGQGSPYSKVIPTKKSRLRLSAEHLHARQNGGKERRANIVAAHVVCNQRRHRTKDPKSPTAFAIHVKLRLAKRKWFYGNELKLLTSAQSCGQAVSSDKIRSPVALRPLKNPS